MISSQFQQKIDDSLSGIGRDEFVVKKESKISLESELKKFKDYQK